jgi:hypothetical protein
MEDMEEIFEGLEDPRTLRLSISRRTEIHLVDLSDRARLPRLMAHDIAKVDAEIRAVLTELSEGTTPLGLS